VTFPFFATAALGTEDLVARELDGLGLAEVRRRRGGVAFTGSLVEGMRVCLEVRAALRVLLELGSFAAADAAELHAGAHQVPWESWLTRTSTFAVSATTRAPPPFAHAPFLAQRVKDAIVDRLRARLGGRPDVARHDPDVHVYVHVAPGRGSSVEVAVGLDLAGDSLHARGYRVASTPAPLRETLAAAVLLATGWRGDRPLIDPLCGSGTIAIEAALLACRLAPGRLRRFGFQRWPGFGAEERRWYRGLVEETKAKALARAPVPIVGSDRDPDAIAAARRNAAAAGEAVASSITWRVADARELDRTEPPAVIVSNPPYGERLPKQGVEAFWRQLGGRLRTLDGHTAFLLASSPLLARLGMRPTWTRRLMNGPLAVSLCRYELGRQRRARKR
jgi:putative N6-adenine-specific DNA methylase